MLRSYSAESQCRVCGIFYTLAFYKYYSHFFASSQHWEDFHPRRFARFRERLYSRPWINPIETAPEDGSWIKVYSDHDVHLVRWEEYADDGSPHGLAGFAYAGNYAAAITDYQGWLYASDEEVDIDQSLYYAR